MIERDGTSQAGRVQPALDPAHALLDERTPYDLLAFARKYAEELVYYDEQDRPAGDWSGFLDHDLASLAALVEGLPPGVGPGHVDRPHLALFLAFLRLLRHPRDLINGFTRRHLEHYYEVLLRMTRKPAVPDRVHVLVRLANGAEQARLPEGTLLRAGKDELGRERVYRTDRELVVSRAAVARLSSVYAQTEVVGLRDAREQHTGTRDEAFVKALEVALGNPRPGDPLPKYAGKAVTPTLLQGLRQRVLFSDTALFMDFADLRAVMTLQRRRAAADGEWQEINKILQKIGQARVPDPNWQLAPVDPRAFATNLEKALGGPLDFGRDGLPDVENLHDLYDQRLRADVRAFIATRLHLSDADFAAMMVIKIRIDNEWREIDRILEQAGGRKRGTTTYRLDPGLPSTDFKARLAAAVEVGQAAFARLAHPELSAITDIEAYYNAIVALEAYFRMSAAQVGYILDVAAKPAIDATDGEWRKVERLLTEAHQEKVYADRRRVLQRAFEDTPDRAVGFAAMLRIVLETDADGPEPSLAQLQPFLAGPGDEATVAAFKAALAVGMPSAGDRARVYGVLELAQRARERLPDPVPQRATWLALHAAADATTVVAGPDEPAAGPLRWKTFGQRPPILAADVRPPAMIGWAITSPTLVLAQGMRTITLTLGLRTPRFDAARVAALFATPDANPFEVEISTVKGWLALAVKAVVGDYRVLSAVSRVLPEPLAGIQLTMTLEEGAPATGPPDRSVGVVTKWPLLRLRLRPLWDGKRRQHVLQYEALRDLILAAVHLRADVVGLVPAAIQSDDAVLVANKPFEPFGASPAVGSRFHVGDPELVHKRLDRLTFRVEWRGVPADLDKHYANYDDSGAFTARISLIDNTVRMPLTDPPVALFNADATTPRSLMLEGIATRVEKPGLRYRYDSLADAPTGGPVATWPRRFEWELTPRDFGHQTYPAVATRKALAMAAALLAKPTEFDAATYQVKPPYTPKVKALLVDYTASAEVLADDAGRPDRLFHVHPFGACPVAADADADGIRLLPRYDHEGELYIGLQGVRTPESITLLFQMAEGVADPDLAPVPVEWSYLDADRWRTLHDGHLLADTTGGLIDTGIVQIALPPAAPSTRLPGDLYWLRVAIAYNPDSVCDALAIRAQAVSATFVDRGNSSGHCNLPARSITGLVQRVAQIAAVEQPFPSRGGRPTEAEGAFYTRVSERLRHKQRALTPWDYERLALERFPELYKAKCIPADARDPEGLGVVQLVVIPAVHGQSTANQFEPKVPAALVAEIAAYLAERSPPRAVIRVRNAHFVQVKVRAGVRFRGGGDEGYYRKLLVEELNRHLSPWAYDEGTDIVIGSKIFANSIVSFIDSRDYVDYVATIKLFRSDDGGRTFDPAPPPTQAGYFVATERADGVLVAARHHEIDPISAVEYTGKSLSGINYMKLELDFVVTGSK